MNIRKLREQFPNEAACRKFIESIIWRNGRICPNCQHEKTWPIKGETSRPGLYECGKCKRHFAVTTRTQMHITKLPFRGVTGHHKLILSCLQSFPTNSCH